MTICINPKDCFLIVSGTATDSDRRHLFVILTPAAPNGQHVAVSLSKVSPTYYCDEACRIQPGEYKFVLAESFIRYQRGKALSAQQLQALIDGGHATPYPPPVSDALHSKICDGLLQSAFTPPWLRTLYQTAAGA